MNTIQRIAIFALLIPALAHARPVSYQEGVTLIQKNNVNRNSLLVHVSPTAKYSIGYRGEYWRDAGFQFHGAQFNRLLKRWNRKAAQANVYLKAGAGVIQDQDDTFALSGFLGFATDWENRRFFTAYENRIYDAGNIERFFFQRARVGVAPYVGDYGDLHTWFMLQVESNPEFNNEILITPVLRFFKGDYLGEIGVNQNGNPLLNFIIRF